MAARPGKISWRSDEASAALNTMETEAFAEQLRVGIEHAIRAHQLFPRAPETAVRFWDHKTPYVVHPILASALLLAEIELPDSIREPGYLALL